jgi:hypothetical protein
MEPTVRTVTDIGGCSRLHSRYANSLYCQDIEIKQVAGKQVPQAIVQRRGTEPSITYQAARPFNHLWDPSIEKRHPKLPLIPKSKSSAPHLHLSGPTHANICIPKKKKKKKKNNSN